MDESYHTQCLICGSSQLKQLKGYESQFLVRCKACGFTFAGKIPGQQELVQYYDGYRRNHYLSPVTIKRYHQLLERFESGKSIGNMIDVGCGSGYFLEAAKQKGWQVFGTEFTDAAVSICRGKGINMSQGPLDARNYQPESFDVVTSFEVLEHINNPLEEAKQFHALLRRGGMVYVTTPNFNSLSRFILKSKWNVLTYPEHLSYFTPATLKNLFSDCGFRLVRMETTGISITRATRSLHIATATGSPELSADEKLRRSFESNVIMKTIKQFVNQLLTFFSAGDTIKATFIKM